MAASVNLVRELVIHSLARQEERLLKLTVTVRKGLNADHAVRGGAAIRGDLAQSVKLCLRKLVAAGQVTERDGVYSLSHEMKSHVRARAGAVLTA